MVRLDPTTGTFTSTHLNFVRLCLETRSYAAAEPIIDNYIHTLPATIPNVVRDGLEYSVPCADVASSGDYIHQHSGHSDKITLADVQEYYLLGAMGYMGLRQYKKAQQLLEHVLIAPSTNTANGLMLEAYKKWVLISCLVEGKVCSMSTNHDTKTNRVQSSSSLRSANGNAIKQIKAASKAYDALADAYQQLDNLPKLKAQVQAGTEVWAEVRYATAHEALIICCEALT